LIKHLVFVTAVLTCGSRLGADQITVLPATYDITVGSGPNNNGVCCASEQTYTTDGSYALGGASASFTESPDMTAQASAGPLSAAGGTSYYYFTVVGAQSGVPVNVLVSGSLSTTGDDSQDATGIAEITAATFLQIANATAESDNNPTWAGTLSVEYESDLPAGSDYVSLMVSAQDGGGAGSASTFADPVSIRA
jgi:hypothetical protein